MIEMVSIHVSGNCLEDSGPGGWAATIDIFRWEDEGTHQKLLLTGGNPATTQNAMELQAVEKALSFVRDHIPRQEEDRDTILYLKGKYAFSGLAEWIQPMRRMPYSQITTKQIAAAVDKSAENVDLWQRLENLQAQVQTMGQMRLVYVHPYEKKPELQMADAEAVKACDQSLNVMSSWTGPTQEIITSMSAEFLTAKFAKDEDAPDSMPSL